jgi:hypothetical protein
MKALLAGARARYMEYDTETLTDLRGRMVEVGLTPGLDDGTYWLARESVRTIDDVIMGRAVV